MTKVIIRNLRKSDAEVVSLLIPQLTENIVEPEKLIYWLRFLANTYKSHWQYMVAEKDEVVVGFGGLVWYPVPSKRFMGQIEEVVVDKPHRKQGIARLVMVKLIRLAKKQGLRQVKLSTGNPCAKKLYESLGFVKKDEDLFVLKLN